jgi:hypothetical protein
MKKGISLALTVSMLVFYAVPMHAASGGWKAIYEEPATSANPINKDTEYIETITLGASEYCDGTSGKVLHAKFARSTKQTNTYILAENSLSGALDSSKTYNFSFYAKGTFQNNGIGIYAGIGTNENLTSGGMVNLAKTTRYTATTIANGWKLYTFSGIAYDGSGNHFRIKIEQKCTDFYVDNVSLKASGEEEELIVDGGFEDADFVETEDVGNQAQYAPTNLIASQYKERIMLSWRNPENTTLSKVSLYEITDSGETLVKGDCTKTAKAYVNYDIADLVEGSKHIYKVVCEFGTSTKTESVISAIASSKRDPSPLGSNPKDGHPGTVLYEHNDTHSGKGAVRVISNLSGWISNNYIMAQTPTLGFTSNSEYEISLWIKGTFANSTNINYKDAIKNGDPATLKYDGGTPIFNEVETDTNGWKHIVFRINGLGSKSIAFMGEHRTDMLVDDITIYKIEKNGDYAKDPLYTQDFEGWDAEVKDVTIDSSEINRSLATINFTAPENMKRVRVYLKDGDNLSKRADVFPEDGKVSFTHLKNDYHYTYVVKAVDQYFNESPGVEITLTPTPDDYEIVEYGLYNGIVPITDFESGKTYTAKATIKNNKVDEGVDAQVIAVVRKDGERINAVASNATKIAKNKYDESPETLSTGDIMIPDITDGKYEISVYLWDGLDTMTILRTFKIYKEKVTE